MESPLLMLATTFAILASIFYVWAKYKLTYWQQRGVPTLPTNLIFGNFKDAMLLRVSPGYLLGRLYNEAKGDPPFLGIYIMHKPFLILRDPKIIKQMIIKDFNFFQNRYFSSRNRNDKLGTDNLFSINNPEWKYIRTKLSPTFTSGKLKQLFHLMVETSDNMKNYLDKKFADDKNKIQSIEVKDTSTMYTTDIVASLAFGISTNSFDQPTPEFYKRSREQQNFNIGFAIRIFSAFFFPSLSRLFNNSFFGKNTDYFREVFWTSMNAREKSKTERGDVMDSLLKLKNEKQDAQFRFEGDSLVAQSAIFFIAGLESSSVTISFALYELARRPDLQNRVRTEIIDNLNKFGGLTYDSIQNMKYLMQVINETLRLYPPAPIIDRVATEDYKIPDTDIIIEKGTAIYIPLPGVHRNPKFHPDPEKFDPDRFSEERKNDIESCTFLPFGEGPRICIAFRVGMLQTAVGLIRILQGYEVSVNPNYKTEISTRNIFTTPANGIHLYFKKLNV
ncbi:GSCOCT00007844001.2-RA-CDS [Cotesia congregata]|uniref:CYP6BD14 n=1 Tax=Cotesia congregata TaxID=51543 RepID=A0A8J2HAY8_COTCN|nr:GSCOCT00007844001.2-RA-CDS [Cotesia congregata]CAG5090038.1 CYP6BD14 [Cotesia congregata]